MHQEFSRSQIAETATFLVTLAARNVNDVDAAWAKRSVALIRQTLAELIKEQYDQYISSRNTCW